MAGALEPPPASGREALPLSPSRSLSLPLSLPRRVRWLPSSFSVFLLLPPQSVLF